MKNLEYYAKGLFAENGPWITYIHNKGYTVTQKTLHTKQAILDSYIIPFWGKYEPDKITIKKINRKLFTAKSIQTGKDLSFNTKNRILYLLSSIFNYLIEEDILENNIVKKIKKFNSVPQKPRGIISDFDLLKLFPKSHEALLKIWRNQMFVCAFLIMKDTGLRNNEILALRWGNWYKELNCLTILHGIESGTKDKENNTKTGKARVVLLYELTARELEIYRKEKQALDNDYIFSRGDKKPIFGQRLTTAFHIAVKRAGINRPDYTPYWFRHTVASGTLDSLPFDIARRLLGHNNLETTLRYRSRNIESLLKEAVLIRAIKENSRNLNILQLIMTQRQLEQVGRERQRHRVNKIKIAKIDKLYKK